ncbi:MAG: hypothetical protein EAX96_20525 [Candidatus Lokiarchaeota archaeon]|nr:hypothetical protein [Candidatus Lokiarchaeota archaeon]
MQEYEEEIEFSVKDIINYRTLKAVLLIFAIGFISVIIGLAILHFIGYQPAIILVQYILNTLVAPEGLTKWIYGYAVDIYTLTFDANFFFILIITNNFLRILLSSIGAALFWVSIIGFYKYFIKNEKKDRNPKLYIIGIAIFIVEYFLFDDQFTISALIILPLIFGGIIWLIRRIRKQNNNESFINTFLKISIYSIFVAELLTFVFHVANYFVFVPAPFTTTTEWFTTVAPHLFIELIAIMMGTAIGYFIAVDMRQALDEEGIDGFLDEGEAILSNKKIWKAVLITLVVFVIGGLVEAYFSILYIWPAYGSYEFTVIGNLIWEIFLNWGPIILICGILYLGTKNTKYWPFIEIIIIVLIIEGIFYLFSYLNVINSIVNPTSTSTISTIFNPFPENQPMALHFVVMALFFSGEAIQNFAMFSVLILFVIVTKLVLDYRKKKLVYTGSIENPITQKGIFNAFSVQNSELLKYNLINGIFPIMPMILLLYSIEGLDYFQMNIILFLFLVWRFRGTTDKAMTLKISPMEFDEHGNTIIENKGKKEAFMSIIMKLYYVGMLVFNIYSIYNLIISDINQYYFFYYTLSFVKQLILAIVLLPFLTTFGSIFLVKLRDFFGKIKFNLKGQFIKALLYSIPVSILAVGILIGLSYFSTFLIFGVLDFNTALSIATSYNLDTTYFFSVNLWLTVNVLIFFSIFIIIGYVSVQFSIKYKISKVYIIFCTVCLSFPLMWILLPSTHYLVSATLNFIFSGQNWMISTILIPIFPDIPTTWEMVPWLLVNSALGGLWGLITFFPVFILITIRSFVSIIGLPDLTGFLSENYLFFPNLYYQNFIFLLNFSLIMMGAIIIGYYVFYVKKLEKKQRRKKFKRTN